MIRRGSLRVLQKMGAIVILTALLGFIAFSQWGMDYIHAAEPIVAGDFDSLKAAIEDPDRDTEVVVPGGDYVFTDTITVTKDLTIRNQPGEKVNFKRGIISNFSKPPGKTMMNLTNGTLILSGEDDQSLVFDGGENWTLDHKIPESKDEMRAINYLNISAKGVLLTVGPDTNFVLNHGTFKNTANSGGLTGAILVDYNSSFIMNGGKITHNFHIVKRNPENNNFYRQNVNIYGYSTHGAGVALFGGSMEMNGGSIDDNYVGGYGGNGGAIVMAGTKKPAVNIEKWDGIEREKLVRARLTINGGEISSNSAHSKEVNASSSNYEPPSARGGAILAGTNSDVVINNGDFTDNYAYGAGGVIFMDWATSLTVNGGNFVGNVAESMGGAIGTADRYMAYDISSDTNINTVNNPFHINSIDDWYNVYGLGVNLLINKGNFIDNKAYMGGALYIANDNGQINGGSFINNEANRFGGAIYLACMPYKLTIRNAYITGNIADDSYGSMGEKTHFKLNTNVFHTGSGGGIWYCPTGSGRMSVSNGAAVFDNIGEVEGDDFTSMKKYKNTDYNVSLSNRMLGGGRVDWYDDNKDHRFSEGDQARTTLTDVKGDLTLKAEAKENSKNASRRLASTIFTGNKAKRGGAIATNGHIDFGDANYEFNLKVQKKWSDDVKIKKDVKVNLSVVTDQGESIVDSALLSSENEYSYTFENLPLLSSGIMTYKVSEEGDDYKASYEYKINDGDIEQGDTFTTENLVNGDVVDVIVTNSPKEEVVPPEPENPHKPDNPGDQEKESSQPETGDERSLIPPITIILISSIGLVFATRRLRRKDR